jgi:hypothetical protein
MFHEGQTVTSIGDGSDGIPLGSHGRILSLAYGDAGHIQWNSGALTGSVTFVPSLDESVAPSSRRVQAAYAARDGLEDSLEVGPISQTGARHLMAISGPSSVLQQLASMGALAETGELGEEALAFVESRLRHSANLTVHLAELDEEDQNEVYRLASRSLVSDALGWRDDD